MPTQAGTAAPQSGRHSIRPGQSRRPPEYVYGGRGHRRLGHFNGEARGGTETRCEARCGVFPTASLLHPRPKASAGVPARIFPEYLVCPRCGRLALHTSFNFDESRPEYTCSAAHKGGGRAVVFPARFMVACPRGHLDDFPWALYVHGDDVDCRDELRLRDSGKTGAITDLWVRCDTHNISKNIGQAMGAAARSRLPRCTGNRPWLGPAHRQQCDREIHVILRGASNAVLPRRRVRDLRSPLVGPYPARPGRICRAAYESRQCQRPADMAATHERPRA